MRVDFSRSTPLVTSPRSTQVEGMFGMESATTIERHWSIDLPLDERSWTIGLVVGPSGSGKTTVLEECFDGGTSSTDAEWPTVSAVIDGFEDNLDTDEIVRTLTGVGFSSPPAWLRPFHTLSTGEQFRADLARTLLWARSTGTVAVVDEFTSTVDRTVAKTASVAVSRLLRGAEASREGIKPSAVGVEADRSHPCDLSGITIAALAPARPDASPYLVGVDPAGGPDDDKIVVVANPAYKISAESTRLVAASCHYDIIDWLQPDWLLDMAAGSFTWRSLHPRPPINLDIRRATHDEWAPFAPHHYLSAELSKRAHCYLASIDGRPAVFVAVLPQPSPKGYQLARASRTVCLPDFQGLGLGHAVAETVAAAYKAQNWRYRSTTSHPAMIGRRARSPLWDMVRAPAFEHGVTASTDSTFGTPNRRTATFEYVGPSNWVAADVLEVPRHRMPQEARP